MIARTVALAVALSLCSPAALAADAVRRVPVHFAKGTTGTTVKGAIKGYDTVEYLVAARAGQTLRVTVSGSGNANINVYPRRDGSVSDAQAEALPLETTGREGRVVLPADGEYRIEVYQFRAIARRGTVSKFALKIDIR